jgi:5-(carboxyamino)imidazole ribonucleotide synthase
VSAALPPGAWLGVLGGGQLGRMFVHAAQTLGYRCAVLDPDPDSPAGAVAHRHWRADYLDAAALSEFGQTCAAVTTEFENVPAAALAQLAQTIAVAPAAEAVAICQDRSHEKACFARCGVDCAPHATITDAAQLEQALTLDLLPGILKTARLGYDGKGQIRVASADALRSAWRELNGVACVLERELTLVNELSVIVVRGHDGNCVDFPVQQNLHRSGILALTEAPAPDIPAELAARAIASARALARSLAYVGVLCVEFFVVADGRLLANEMAPRPHNSGHWTIAGCDVSQFELQVRALAGLPLVEPRQHSAAVMLNLLGELWFDAAGSESPREPDWCAVLALAGVHLHLYGKSQPRRGRKMGHLTVTAPTAALARETAQQAARRLGIAAFDFGPAPP